MTENPETASGVRLSGRIPSTKLRDFLNERGNVLTLNSGWAANG
jgi:hypothetical protein